MTKAKSHYQCELCGCHTLKWVGQCPECNSWNSLAEVSGTMTTDTAESRIPHAQVQSLDQVDAAQSSRHITGIEELDRVLGGGLVPGSVILLGGPPGIGKSTLLMQTLAGLQQHGKLDGLYISAEESPQQIALRARRLNLPLSRLQLLGENVLEYILDAAEKTRPQVLVMDSIQTCCSEQSSSAAGSVSQVRDCTVRLSQYAKHTNTAVFLVGHVTKGGDLAGPRVLEHMVDTVLYFEGESDHRYRMLRTVKNRFGAVNELGVFAMTERGLRAVSNPSAIFLAGNNTEIPGSVIMATREGTRAFLIEVQALVDECHGEVPRRMSLGLDSNRLAMILAVLHRHVGIAAGKQDIYINIAGGVRVNETAIDLALVLTILSSLHGITLPRNLVTFGEVGLSGEIRPVQNGIDRLQEAVRHGFKQALIPATNLPRKNSPDIDIIAVNNLSEVLARFNAWKD